MYNSDTKRESLNEIVGKGVLDSRFSEFSALF